MAMKAVEEVKRLDVKVQHWRTPVELVAQLQ
jgi:hypothetical protein